MESVQLAGEPAACVSPGRTKTSVVIGALSRAFHSVWLLYLVSVLGFYLVWDFVAVHKVLRLVATPVQVLAEIKWLWANPLAGYTLAGHTWASCRRVLIGWSLASAVGIPLGLFMALNDYVRAIVKPIFDLLKPMPPIAWISFAILWMGIGESSKVFIIMIGAFVPCVLNAYNGIRLVEPELYDVIGTLGGSRRHEIFLICFPAALPAIFAGLQISLSMAWMCVIAAELVSSQSGLGFLIISGMNELNAAMILAGMVIIALVAWVTSAVMSYLEKVLCPWRRDISAN